MPEPAKSAPKKGSKKAVTKTAGKGGKKRKRSRKESYAIYVYKVLKQVHPDTGISSKAMGIMNSFVNDIFERIAGEASRLAHYNKRSTISSREIQTAVRLLLPGELAKHAVSEGTKAVTKYTSSNIVRMALLVLVQSLRGLRVKLLLLFLNRRRRDESRFGRHMAVYDEDLLRNPFYQALERQRPELSRRVAEHHGIILVPRCGSLTRGFFTDAQFDGYVLQPTEQGYQTLDGKEVSISSNQVHVGAGCASPLSVAVLFEETFYNEREQAFSVLCIARPLDPALSPADHFLSAEELAPVPSPHCLRSIEDVREFLGRHAEKLDKFVEAFCQCFQEQERKGLRHHICLLRDSRLVRKLRSRGFSFRTDPRVSSTGLSERCSLFQKLLARQEIQMTLLKEAVEMYIHHGVYDLLFRYVGSLEAARDAAFNKTTRSLQELQQKELGIKSEFSINIPRAKRELTRLNVCSSPHQKLLCIRRAIVTVTQCSRRGDTVASDALLSRSSVVVHLPAADLSLQRPPVHLGEERFQRGTQDAQSTSIEAMCADDLLLVILYLLIKTEIPNWSVFLALNLTK
ncbi:hypothetical protein DNTS_011868 [Danionella cerebrum]|uniref:Histone H2B n=1 Tax=Danionella cerebrum TaxID=2873325 RepID=A0A553Q7B3_9TELE|nr:hypothetical protein DNTS_011868 [Danionella translucida]TRY85824.1 hypothetical protein DNTS_011868 [Danionella translucida]TRY85825.1 hypothetical protein DNTS_011868 [Danionella translucida]TRY85826.1 hypothetical protein DNTS_011868 [Danionella translucida]TRY85827.1 hypothetical protein DNTS_011868 [Danionella translucida]